MVTPQTMARKKSVDIMARFRDMPETKTTIVTTVRSETMV